MEITLPTNDHIAELKIKLREIIKFEIKDLERKDLGIKFKNFSDASKTFGKYIQLYEDVDKYIELESIPLKIFEQINNRATDACNQFEKIKTFDPPEEEPFTKANELINVTIRKYGEDLNILIPYLVQSKKPVEIVKDDIRAITNAKEKANGILIDADKILNQLKQISAETGVSKFSGIFKKQARKYFWSSIAWLVVTVAVTSYTLNYAINSYKSLEDLYLNETNITTQDSSNINLQDESSITKGPGLNSNQIVQLAISRLIIFALLYFGIVWAGRNFRTNLHNNVINKHRQNALNTFEVFAESAKDDPPTKNAVLLEATKCIFSPQASGYVTSGTDPKYSPQIIEIFKGISKG